MTQATQQADPWATASQAATGAAEAAKPADPNADPFASPDEIGGSSGPRGPKWAEILDRLVVLKPVKLLTDQPVPGDPNKTQSIYVATLTVLGSESVTVVSPATEKDGKSYPESSETFLTPFTWENWYAYGRGIEVKLSGLEKAGKPMLLGVVKRCPTGSGYKAGETVETTAKKWTDYRAAILAGRDPAKPQFSWGIVDPTPDQRAVALAWYRGQ
jgi:hypothetical protein